MYRYLVWLETHHFAENTVNIRRLQLSRFITWCDDRSVTLARQVTPELIERFQRHLYYYRKKDGQPLSISSQSHWLTSLRSWMKWMKDQRIVELNPALEMVFPKEEKRLPRHALTQAGSRKPCSPSPTSHVPVACGCEPSSNCSTAAGSDARKY